MRSKPGEGQASPFWWRRFFSLALAYKHILSAFMIWGYSEKQMTSQGLRM